MPDTRLAAGAAAVPPATAMPRDRGSGDSGHVTDVLARMVVEAEQARFPAFTAPRTAR